MNRYLVTFTLLACATMSQLNVADEPSIQGLDVGTEWYEITDEIQNRERPYWSLRIFKNPKNNDLLAIACSKVPHKRSFDDTMEFAPGGYPFWIPDDREIVVNRVKTERTDLFKFPGSPVDTIEYAFVSEIGDEDSGKSIMGQGYSLVMRENAYYVQHTSTRPISHSTAKLVVDRLLGSGRAK
ncbi:hypothetical protein SH501x_001902 [Pirellulaceae bacterium SH501]